MELCSTPSPIPMKPLRVTSMERLSGLLENSPNLDIAMVGIFFFLFWLFISSFFNPLFYDSFMVLT